MKFLKLSRIAAALMMLTLAGSAFADPPRHNWDNHRPGHHFNGPGGFRNDHRGFGPGGPGSANAAIRQGVRTGNLTPAEVAKLKKQQEQIQRYSQLAHRDGNISPQEAARLKQLHIQQQKNIRRELHDNQRR